MWESRKELLQEQGGSGEGDRAGSSPVGSLQWDPTPPEQEGKGCGGCGGCATLMLLLEAPPFPAGLRQYLHDAVEARLQAAQVLLLHLNLLQDLFLDGQAFLVPLCQPTGGGNSVSTTGAGPLSSPRCPKSLQEPGELTQGHAGSSQGQGRAEAGRSSEAAGGGRGS